MDDPVPQQRRQRRRHPSGLNYSPRRKVFRRGQKDREKDIEKDRQRKKHRKRQKKTEQKNRQKKT